MVGLQIGVISSVELLSIGLDERMNWHVRNAFRGCVFLVTSRVSMSCIFFNKLCASMQRIAVVFSSINDVYL